MCPWNVNGEAVPDDALMPLLPELMALDDDGFRRRFSKSAIARTRRRGLLRNAAVVLGNSGNRDAVAVLARSLGDETEPLVRSHAAWALGRLGGVRARTTLERRRKPSPTLTLVPRSSGAGPRLLAHDERARKKPAGMATVATMALRDGRRCADRTGRGGGIRDGPQAMGPQRRARNLVGHIESSHNSQSMFDPTFSHVTHGVLWYGLLSLIAKRLPVGARFVAAVALECAWEVFENTDLVIQRYRAATISLNYYGDSVMNSMCDIGASLVGFMLAAILLTRVTLIAVIALEIGLALWIRDSLLLNVLMLVRPVQAIRSWQLGK